MKNKLIKTISFAVTAIMLCFAMAGCNQQESSSENKETTTATEGTTSSADLKKSTDISALHSYDENGDALAGAWKITGGEGEQYKSFIYLFDGKGSASLIVDNMGYMGKYTADDTKFACQLMYGINGKYTYKKEDKTITLTNTETYKTTTLEKCESFSILPKPDGEINTDEKLLGAWASENGEYYYFGADGVMYHNQFSTIYNYASYSTSDGKIKSRYVMSEEVDEEFEYQINEEDVLTIDGYEYKRISADELK